MPCTGLIAGVLLSALKGMVAKLRDPPKGDMPKIEMAFCLTTKLLL